MASPCHSPEGFIIEHADALLALVQGGSISSLSATGPIGETSGVILVDATTAEVTATLPSVADVPAGKTYTVKKTDAAANDVIVEGAGAETIDGAANVTLTAQNDYVTVISDGTEWWITSKTITP